MKQKQTPTQSNVRWADDPGFKVVTARVLEHLAGQHDQADHGKWAADKGGSDTGGSTSTPSAPKSISVGPTPRFTVTVAKGGGDAPARSVSSITARLDKIKTSTLVSADPALLRNWGRGTLQEVAEVLTRSVEKMEAKPGTGVVIGSLTPEDYFTSPETLAKSAVSTVIWDDNLGIQREETATDSTQYDAPWTQISDGDARQIIRAATRELIIRDVAQADEISQEAAAAQVDEVMGHIAKELASDETKIIMGIPFNAFGDVVTEGVIRNQAETGTSGGVLDVDFRNQFEEIVFGESGKAHYAYLDVNGTRRHANFTDNAGQYGRIELTFDNRVKERSTFSTEDSLDTWGSRTVPNLPSPILDPQWESFSVEMLDTTGIDSLNTSTEFDDVGGNNYVEAQIHGHLSLGDVNEITVYPSQENAWMSGSRGPVGDQDWSIWVRNIDRQLVGQGFTLATGGPEGPTKNADGLWTIKTGMQGKQPGQPLVPLRWIRKQTESNHYNTYLYNNLVEHLPGQHDQSDHGTWAKGGGGGKNEDRMASGSPSAGPIVSSPKVKAIVSRTGNFQRDRVSNIKSWREGKPRERGSYDNRTDVAAKSGTLRWVIDDPQLFASRGYVNLTGETVFDTKGDDSHPREEINSTGTNDTGWSTTGSGDETMVVSRNSVQKSLLMAEARLASVEGRIDDAKVLIAESMQGDGINLKIPHMTVDLSKTTVEEATKGLKVLEVLTSQAAIDDTIGNTWDFNPTDYGLSERWGDGSTEPSKWWSEEVTKQWETEKSTVLVLLDNRQEMLDGLPAWAKISDADATQRIVEIQKEIFVATFNNQGLGSAADAEAAMEKIIARKQELMDAGNVQAVMHVPETALKRILGSSEGKIGNQHEVGGGYGLRDVEIRKSVEQAMFGNEWSPEEAPKYMYANRADLPDEQALAERSQYGKFALVFDRNALGNATAYPGDTLDKWSRSADISDWYVSYAINSYNDHPEDRLSEDLQTHIALYVTQDPGIPLPIETWANTITPEDVALLTNGYRVPEEKGAKYDPNRKDVYVKGVDGVIQGIEAQWMAGEGNGRSYDEIQMHGALNIADASEVRLLPSDVQVDWTNDADPGQPGIKYTKPYMVPGSPAGDERYQPVEGIDKIGIKDPAKVQAAVDLLTKNLATFGFALAEGGAIKDGKVVIETVKYKTGDQVFEITGQITKPIRWIKQYTKVKESLLFGVSSFMTEYMEVTN